MGGGRPGAADEQGAKGHAIMNPATDRKRILLAGVFGPYGVDDEYGRKENIMELFHNQVTKAQGVGSFRFFHRSFGLYFLAANIDADVTVLDFPSKARFEREVKKGYDIVGISFITPNFRKAARMAEMTRELAPAAEIIIGGHGAAIEGVEELIDCDHVVKGEGIRWLRAHLGQDPDAPIAHPILPSTEKQYIMGMPVPGPSASILVPGVGCVNGCNFCCTSHFFGKRYTSFIDTGRQMFETARTIAEARGSDAFFIMDENFLKNRERAMELIEEMERHERFFRFHIFSSAEAITAFGLDNLVRLGVQMIWIGFESVSAQGFFAKNVGIDGAALVKELRDRGIIVLGSGILCMEHHTPQNMQRDVDFLVDLEADMVQFMLYTPLPVTALYEDHKRRGLLREDLPFEEWHGQKHLAYRHPEFEGDEPEKWIRKAFRQDYEVNSSTMYRVLETTLRGYLHLLSKKDRDALLETRLAQFRGQLTEYSLLVDSIIANSVNDKERDRGMAIRERIDGTLGTPSLATRAARTAARALTAAWKVRTRLFGDIIQPATIVTRFADQEELRKRLPMGTDSTGRKIPGVIDLPPAAAAMITAD